MTRLAFVLVALAGCGAAGPEAKTAAAAEGGKAPDFELPTTDGGRVSLAKLRGKVVLVDFWSTICDPCKQEMPQLVKLYNERKDKGFEVLAVATDGPETVANVTSQAKALGMIFPVLLDTDTAVLDRYDPDGRMPFTEVIDRHGTVVLMRSGYQPGDTASEKSLVEAIDKAIAAQ